MIKDDLISTSLERDLSNMDKASSSTEAASTTSSSSSYIQYTTSYDVIMNDLITINNSRHQY